MGRGRALGLEVRGGVVVAAARDVDIFLDHRLALAAELAGHDAFECLEADAHHAERGAQRQRVLRHLVARDVGKRANRQRTQLHAGAASPGLMESRWGGRAPPSVSRRKMAVHCVLIERDEQVNTIAQALDWIGHSAGW